MISDNYSIYVSLLTKGKEYILLKDTWYNALSFRICTMYNLYIGNTICAFNLFIIYFLEKPISLGFFSINIRYHNSFRYKIPLLIKKILVGNFFVPHRNTIVYFEHVPIMNSKFHKEKSGCYFCGQGTPKQVLITRSGLSHKR